MINQNIFKRMYVAELRDNVRNGETICNYFKQEMEYPAESIIESTIKADPDKLKLKYREQGESASNDLDNAIALYEAFPELTETQASDPRLWTYLTHVTLRDYVFARWPLEGSCEQMKDERQKATTADFILSHWFASGGNDRLLRRNAAARLWWPVHLTHAPWLRDPEFFADLKKTTDPYRFTKILLSMESIYAEVLERGLGRDNRILITVLEFLEVHKGTKRDQIRSFMKELNLFLSVKNLSLLSRDQMKEAIFSIGEEAIKM